MGRAKQTSVALGCNKPTNSESARAHNPPTPPANDDDDDEERELQPRPVPEGRLLRPDRHGPREEPRRDGRPVDQVLRGRRLPALQRRERAVRPRRGRHVLPEARPHEELLPHHGRLRAGPAPAPAPAAPTAPTAPAPPPSRRGP